MNEKNFNKDIQKSGGKVSEDRSGKGLSVETPLQRQRLAVSFQFLCDPKLLAGCHLSLVI